MPYISQDVFFDGLWAMVAMVIIPTWTSLLADHPLVEKPYIFTISQAKKNANLLLSHRTHIYNYTYIYI